MDLSFRFWSFISRTSSFLCQFLYSDVFLNCSTFYHLKKINLLWVLQFFINYISFTNYNSIFVFQTHRLSTCININSVHSSVSRMLRFIMTKELAQKFSFTGLGLKRQKCKHEFRSHKAYFILLGKLFCCWISSPFIFLLL